jgi:hypothetical protein
MTSIGLGLELHVSHLYTSVSKPYTTVQCAVGLRECTGFVTPLGPPVTHPYTWVYRWVWFVCRFLLDHQQRYGCLVYFLLISGMGYHYHFPPPQLLVDCCLLSEVYGIWPQLFLHCLCYPSIPSFSHWYFSFASTCSFASKACADCHYIPSIVWLLIAIPPTHLLIVM